jgi:uncharacterized protein
MDVAFPWFVDARGHTGTADHDEHVRQLVEQVLFTSPGERVNRPTFGSGLMRMVFDPNREELATATQLLVQGSLQQWLGELIKVEDTSVEIEDSTLRVTVAYRLVRDQQRRVVQFSREVR